MLATSLWWVRFPHGPQARKWTKSRSRQRERVLCSEPRLRLDEMSHTDHDLVPQMKQLAWGRRSRQASCYWSLDCMDGTYDYLVLGGKTKRLRRRGEYQA